MLAVLVSGRLVQTNFNQVGPNKIVFYLDNATEIHNISVFMTGSQPFPPGTGGVVYFSWPPYEHWQYLGWISNDKPSIMLRVKQPHDKTINSAYSLSGNAFQTSQAPTNAVAQIGIELMDLNTIQHQFATAKAETEQATPQNMDFFCKKMLQSLFNYAQSFIQTLPNGVAALPANIFDRWYQNFLHKLQADPNFWKE